MVPTQEEVREIRVFISSTFSDMRAERSYLNTKVFPELRVICARRGVTFTEIDLQWGVTDEQVKEGQEIDICLDEINRSRPFFIGFLGERYGWRPTKDGQKQNIPIQDKDLKKNVERWAGEGQSVTSMEIMHGVLENDEQSARSFFYFRNRAYSETLGEEYNRERSEGKQEVTFVENKGSEKEIALSNLKEELRKNGKPWHLWEGESGKGYQSIEELGGKILSDLKAELDERYPQEKYHEELTDEKCEVMLIKKERVFHACFAQSRVNNYIPDAPLNEDGTVGPAIEGKTIKEMFAYLGSPSTKPLIVTGEMGSGKSALLAKFAELWAGENPHEVGTNIVIQHYAGSGGEARVAWVLRRFLAEIKYELKLKETLPNTDDEIFIAFEAWLALVPQDKKVLMVIDGLNQFTDGDLAKFINAFPVNLQENIHVVISTIQGEVLDRINDKGWPTSIRVNPLDESYRKLLVQGYLSRYSKDLGALTDELIASPNASNPLFLRVVLDELRVDATHDELKERLADYLDEKVTCIVDLFKMVLCRYERGKDKGGFGKRVVQSIFALIWASRNGLSEQELRETLSLTQRELSIFTYGTSSYFSGSSGLYGFMHDALRQAVEDKYMTSAVRWSSHVLLAKYFEKQGVSERKVSELPWQYEQLGEKEGLKHFLDDIRNFPISSQRSGWLLEFVGYLQFSQYDMEEYAENIKKKVSELPSEKSKCFMLQSLGDLLYLSASFKGAAETFKSLKELTENLYNKTSLETANANLDAAKSYFANCDNGNSENCCSEYLKIVDCLGEPESTSLVEVHTILAKIKAVDGHFDAVNEYVNDFKLLLEEGCLYPRLQAELLYTLAFVGLTKGRKSELQESLSYAKEAIEVHERLYGNSHPFYGKCLLVYASILDILGQRQKALVFYKNAYEFRMSFSQMENQNVEFGIGRALFLNLGDLALRKHSEVTGVPQDFFLYSALGFYAGAGCVNECRKVLDAGIPPDVGSIQMTPLAEAAHGLHYDVCSLLLDRGADVNCQRQGGSTPLMLAVTTGSLKMCEFLIKEGASVNKRKSEGVTALMLASQYGHHEICKLLLENDPTNLISSCIEDGRTALMLASEKGFLGVCDLLISYDKSIVNFTEANGKTALMWAAQNGHAEVCQLLLNNGANVKSFENDGQTALMYSSGNGHACVCRLLLENGANIAMQTEAGRSALSQACHNGHTDSCLVLLEHHANVNEVAHEGRTPLILAAEGGHLDTCSLLLDQGAEVDAVGNFGESALIIAAEKGHYDLCSLLLEKGAVINLSAGRNLTSVTQAVQNGNVETIRLLLENGGEQPKGLSLLSIAAFFDNYDACNFLLNYEQEGVYLFRVERILQEALDYSIKRASERICRCLVEHGADAQVAMLVASRNGWTQLCEYLLDSGVNVDVEDENGLSVLMMAAQFGQFDICKLLIARGANVNTLGKVTALFFGVKGGYYNVCNLLIEAGAEVNERLVQGYTALIVAAHYGHINICRLLLNFGADRNLVAGNNYTALKMAQDYGQAELVRLLLSGDLPAEHCDCHFDLQVELKNTAN